MSRRVSRIRGTTLTDINPYLDFFGSSVDVSMRVDDLRAYLSSVEDFLRESSARWMGERSTHGIDEAYVYEESFPSILYSTVIAAAVGLLERDLRRFAERVRQAEGLSLSLRELSGSWLDRFLIYTDKVARIDVALSPQLVEDTRAVVEVRNCLVHCGGELAECQGRRVIEAFVGRKGLGLIASDVLRADRQLADAAINIVSTFIDTCYDSALRAYPDLGPVTG